MNYRIILFSGIITALIGTMIGLAAVHMAEKRVLRDLNDRNFMIVGAGLGFVMGTVQEAIRQQQNLRERENNKAIRDEWSSK